MFEINVSYLIKSILPNHKSEYNNYDCHPPFLYPITVNLCTYL